MESTENKVKHPSNQKHALLLQINHTSEVL